MYIFPAANCFTNKKCRKSPKCFNGNIFNINWCFNFNAPWISIQWRSISKLIFLFLNLSFGKIVTIRYNGRNNIKLFTFCVEISLGGLVVTIWTHKVGGRKVTITGMQRGGQ